MASQYRRGKVWWAKSYRDGRMVRVSLKTQDRREARDRLKELEARHASRLAYSAGVVPLATWDDAAQALMEHYRICGTRDVVEAGHRVKRLSEYFSGQRLSEITASAITGYVLKRKAQGMANGTVNIELNTLRKVLKLAVERGQLDRVPPLRTLKPAAPRAGFLERPEVESICQGLSPDLRVAFLIGFSFGWRINSEVLTLPRRPVDLEAGTLTLAPGTTKNDDGRLVYLTPELRKALADQLLRVRTLERELNQAVPWLFPLLKGQRKGQRRLTMDRAWRRACQKAGLKGALKHDLRRSAVRNLINVGVPTRTAMLITGHRSLSVFPRYHIVSPSDLTEATRRLSAHSDKVRTIRAQTGD